MTIAVASGKGGTGKTTVALNLACALATGVRLLDCDVEEPNCHLFLEGVVSWRQVVGIPVPRVDETLCDGCGECGRFCAFNAIVSFGDKPLVFPGMCHGCGGCAKICPRGAIREVENRVGVVEVIEARNVTLVQGRLDIGAPMAPPLVRAVKAIPGEGHDIVLDAPPGTSCPVISALRGADHVVLVTEPIPFGLNDLQLAVEMTRELAVPFGVVVNRAGIGDDRVHAYCAAQDIPLLLEIPDDRRIAEAYSRGKLIYDALPEYRPLFIGFAERLRAAAGPAKRVAP